MVVKEKRGRKRYILIEHVEKIEKNTIINFFRKHADTLNDKIKWRIIDFKDDYIIILIDHKKTAIARDLIMSNHLELRIKPIKTSGTLKALKK